MNSPATNSQDSSEDLHLKYQSDNTIITTINKTQQYHEPRLSKSLNNSTDFSTDSSTNSRKYQWKSMKHQQYHHRHCRYNKLKDAVNPIPIGIFWDIENCQVPKNTSALAIVQKIRALFLDRYYEAEFIVVCDVRKERSQVVDELHDAQVNLIHVSSTSKNAADEKLKQSIRRFAEIYQSPSCVMLLSSDINFAGDLSDLRYRKKIHVILMHNANVADALILCANEHYNFATITEGLPKERLKDNNLVYMLISNLPKTLNSSNIKKRLSFLIRNCGGRIEDIIKNEGIAIVRFCNQDFANRAQKRIQDEDVGGNKIQVITPVLRNYSGRKIKGSKDNNHTNQSMSSLQTFRNFNQLDGEAGRKSVQEENVLTNTTTTTASGLLDSSLGAISRRSYSLQQQQETTTATINPRLHKTSTSSEISDDSNNGRLFDNTSNNFKDNQPVDLVISNLDPCFTVKELKRLLGSMLNEYAVVLGLNVSIPNDGNPIAYIKVNNQQSAQYVISKLHRQKLGNKRIIISYLQNNNLPNLDELKAMIINILKEIPNNRLPLFKFMELFESRYHCTVSISDINKLKDICKITEDCACRMIQFVNEIKTTPSLQSVSQILVPYCTVHCANGRFPNLGWCELNTVEIPNLLIPLNTFINKLNQLLDLHMGCMPLLSFQACYEQEFNEQLPIDQNNGVPLEHLITCVPNVEIKYSGPNKNIKFIKKDMTPTTGTTTTTMKINDSDEESFFKKIPPALAPNLSLFCRELVDLLKTTDRCQLLLSKFIPAYHYHFGRQCHVASYGYTKLLDLLEAIPHVVQILDNGTQRVITLSHPAQMRRFTSDLLRVLKSQPSKQILLDDYAGEYEKIMNRQFNPIDYGLCYINDLLEQIPDNIIVINKLNYNKILISIPKREQTMKEIMKTKQFIMEVIDILRHSPYYTMLFNKFVPAYHHHFGHQCKVSEYGFNKLIELFEAIPEVVRIQKMSNGERTIGLTLDQSFKVLGFEMMTIVMNTTNLIKLADLPEIFLKRCGYPLLPQFWNCHTLNELIDKLTDYIKLTNDQHLSIVNRNFFNDMKIKVWSLLLNEPYIKDCVQLKCEYESKFNYDISLNDIKYLRDIITLSITNDTIYVKLTSDYLFAAQLFLLLSKNNGEVLFNNLEQLYSKTFGKKLNLNDFNVTKVDDLHLKFDFLLYSRWHKKNLLTLNRTLAEYDIALPQQILDSKQNVWQPPGGGVIKRISPPKPDSPPSPDVVLWSPSMRDAELNLEIKLPMLDDLAHYDDLFTSQRSLWMNYTTTSKAPDPAELPSPNKLMIKRIDDNSDLSVDSGMNSKFEENTTQSDPDDTTTNLYKIF